MGYSTTFTATRAATPEQRLWLNVLRLLVLDATGQVPTIAPNERADAVRNSRVWLCFGVDMPEVATLAGFDPDVIRAWAHRQRDSGWPDAVAQPEDYMAARALDR